MHFSKLNFINILIEMLFYVILAFPLVKMGGIGLNFLSLMHGLVSFLILLYIVKCFIKGEVIFFSNTFNILAIAFLVTLLLSCIFSVNLNRSIASLVLLFDAMTIFYVSMSEERDSKIFERIVFVLLGIAIIHVFYAIYKPLMVSATGKGSWYIKGSFFNNNHFAANLELIYFLPIFLLYFKRRMEPWKKYFLWSSVVLLSGALLFSLSKGAILSIVLTFFALILFRADGRKRLFGIISLFFCPQ